MVIDGNSIMNRAFYGVRAKEPLRTSDGTVTNAVLGFANAFLKHVREIRPTHVCVAFDHMRENFRHSMYAGYKANRKGMPEDLAAQMPLIKGLLTAMGVAVCERPGYEADDLIGTVSSAAVSAGMDVRIVTGDRDALQLLDSDRVRVLLPVTARGSTETLEYDAEAFLGEYGFPPSQFLELKAIMGDQSDSVPGVKGIGEVGALKLIREYGTLEGVYGSLGALPEKVRARLSDSREMAMLSRRLVTIERGVPGMPDLESLAFDEGSLRTEGAFGAMARLELGGLMRRLRPDLTPDLTPRTATEPTPGKVPVMADSPIPIIGPGLAPDPPPGDGAVGGPPGGGYTLVTNVDALDGMVDAIAREGAAGMHLLTDADGMGGGSMAGASFALGSGAAYYVTFGPRLSERDLCSRLPGLMGKASVSVHGTKEAALHLLRMGEAMPPPAFDASLAAYLLDPTLGDYGLPAIAERYLTLSPEDAGLLGEGKPRGAAFASMTPSAAAPMACARAAAAMRLHGRMAPMMEGQALGSLLHNVEIPLANVLAGMEETGFLVDGASLSSFASGLEEEMGGLRDRICLMAGEDFNLNSPSQLAEVLYGRLGFPVGRKTKTGRSTDADALERIMGLHGIVPEILRYRQVSKLHSTYAVGLLGMISPRTGRIHTRFNQTVTSTGRISSVEPNLQNIPARTELGRQIRKCFIPGKGSVLIDADYSQVELRVLAHMSGDEGLIDAFAKGRDIHAATAAQVFGVAEGSVTPAQRARAKAVNFGIMYGIGDYGLAKELGVSRAEAAEYMKGYLDRFGGVRRFMAESVRKARETGGAVTILGRVRPIPGIGSANVNVRSAAERVAMNTPIQGSAADIIKVAMVDVERLMRGRRMASRLILQVHDELLVEAPLGEADETAALLKGSMEGAASLRVPLTVDVHMGGSWYDTK